MKGVGSLLDRGVDDGTGGLAEFRRIRASLDAELLQGVDGRLNDLRAALLQVGRKRVVVGAVERVVVPGRRIAVRVEERILAAARDAGGRDVDARRQQRELGVTPAEQGKILQLPFIDRMSHIRRLCLQQLRQTDNLHFLRQLADLEREVRFAAFLHVQIDGVVNGAPEAAQLRGHRIVADFERRKHVLASVGRHGHARDAGVGDPGQNGAGRVGHRPDDRSGIELRGRGSSDNGHEGQRDDGRDESEPCV